MSYRYLLNLALILLSTKLLGLLTRKIKMPQVVGALLAGLILGPPMLNILTETSFISQMSELGVIVILFTAGLGTDIKELKKTGKAGLLVATCGVLVPLGLGALLSYLCARAGLIEADGILSYTFVGAVLTATSVSITVETLKELGRLNSAVGNTILAAALIDDVLGLIVLTLITGFAGGDSNIGMVLIKIILFFAFAIGVGAIAMRFFDWMIARANGCNLHRYPLFAFVLCLLMAYCAEKFFGVSDIIGAFAAGLVIAATPKAKYVESKFDPISYLLLTPIFYASIGIGAQLPKAGGAIVIFSCLLLATAILSKLIGCGLGAKLCHFRNEECLQVGVGMACRGEVALIVAKKGLSLGVLSSQMMTPIIVTVVGCAILTPVMLKAVFRNKTAEIPGKSELAEQFDEMEQLDIASEHFLHNKHNRQVKKDNNKDKNE
ncbi:Na(+)/H(+)-K(+) antiporter GerN [bioreactor metagenome]|uniref:Na(+)/H(+)-K(+) antiporter GerN n=1 Tax=bioreactor metagenome TaxID=1076179 RepID=A0A644WQJ4_9ZZZZ